MDKPNKKGGRPKQSLENGKKLCRGCGLPKTADEFNKCKRYSTGLQSKCKSCEAEYRDKHRDRYKKNYRIRYLSDPSYKKNLQNYYQDNIEAIREKKRELYKCPIKSMSRRAANYKRTALERSTCDGTVTTANLREKFEAQKGICAISGKPLLVGFHLDHIIPLSKGGKHTIGNVQFVNAEENIRKSDKLFYTPQPQGGL